MANLKHSLSAVVVVLFIILTVGSGESDSDSKSLKASVSFTGTQFVIQNNDAFDYPNARITINNNYSLNATLSAGETYTVGMMQFSDKNGNRFTANQKPLNVSISSRLDDGSHGFYSASWD